MIKKLVPIGNSLGIVIDKPILELLGMDRDTEIEVSTDGRKLTLAVAKAGADRFKSAAEKVGKRHAATFRKLSK